MAEVIVRGRTYNHVHVIVNGRTGTHSFQNVSVTRTLNTLGSVFSITFPNRWIQSQHDYILVAGAAIQVVLKEINVLIDGFIEGISSEVDEDSHTIKVVGRDKTGILVDCSPNKFPEFTDLTLKEIAERICEPFDIKVFDLAKDATKFAIAKLRPAETAFNFLNRLSKQRGILLNSTSIAGGGLTLAKVGQYTYKNEKLDYRNVLSCSTKVNASKVFSRYTVISQTNSVTNIDGEQGEIEQETNVIATLNDDSARRKTREGKYIDRPFTMISKKQATNEQAKSRVAWEHAKRKAEMLQINIMVNGWSTRDINTAPGPGNGKNLIWLPNTKIKVDYPHGGVSGVFLISACQYLYGAGESIKTLLTLTHKDAYTPNPNAKASPGSTFNVKFTREQAIEYEKANKLPTGSIVRPDLPTSEK